MNSLLLHVAKGRKRLMLNFTFLTWGWAFWAWWAASMNEDGLVVLLFIPLLFWLGRWISKTLFHWQFFQFSMAGVTNTKAQLQRYRLHMQRGFFAEVKRQASRLQTPQAPQTLATKDPQRAFETLSFEEFLTSPTFPAGVETVVTPADDGEDESSLLPCPLTLHDVYFIEHKASSIRDYKSDEILVRPYQKRSTAVAKEGGTKEGGVSSTFAAPAIDPLEQRSCRIDRLLPARSRKGQLLGWYFQASSLSPTQQEEHKDDMTTESSSTSSRTPQNFQVEMQGFIQAMAIDASSSAEASSSSQSLLVRMDAYWLEQHRWIQQQQQQGEDCMWGEATRLVIGSFSADGQEFEGEWLSVAGSRGRVSSSRTMTAAAAAAAAAVAPDDDSNHKDLEQGGGALVPAIASRSWTFWGLASSN